MKFLSFRRNLKRKLFLFAVISLVLSSGLLIYVRMAQGATRTWDGGGTEGTCPGNANGWSCAQNWSSDTIPGSADIAAFDNTSDKDATIDASFAGSVQGVDINTGYDGTITQARSLTVGTSHFDQASGTWVGGSETFNFNSGNFTVSGGVHTATTGTWTLDRNFTYSGGTLTMTGATPLFDDDDSADDSTVTCSAGGGSIGGTLSVTKNSSGDFTLSSDCTATFGTLDILDLATLTINGTVNGTDITVYANFTLGASGDLNLSGSVSALDVNSAHNTTITCSGNFGATVNVVKDDLGTFTLGSGCTADFGTFTNGSLATFTINGTANGTNMTLYGNLTVGPSGVLNLSGSITSPDTDSSHDTTITCTGNLGPTVNVTKDALGTFTLSSGCIANFGTFINGTLSTFTINGTATGTNMTLYGNLTIGSQGSLTLSGAITVSGTDSSHNTTINCTGILTPTINVSKTSSGAFTLGTGCRATIGTFSMDTGLVTINGTAIGTNMTLNNSLTVGSAGHLNMSGTVTFTDANFANDSTLTCTGTLGWATFVVTKDDAGDFTLASGCTATFGSFSLTSGTGTINGHAFGTNMSFNQNFTVGANGSLNLTGTLSAVDASEFDDSTLTCTGKLRSLVDVNKNSSGNFTLAAGCTANFGTFSTVAGTFVINGTANGSNISTNRDITVGAAGVLNMTGNISFLDASEFDESTFTCNGAVLGTVVVNKDSHGDFTLGSGCNVNFGTFVIRSGALIINGTANGSNVSFYRSLTIGAAGVINMSGTISALDATTFDDTTLTCTGSITSGNLTINKANGGDVTIGSSCTIPGNLTRTDGLINNPASAYVLTVYGNFSTSTSDAFGGANLTINLVGPNNQTITQNAGSLSSPIVVNKPSGRVTQTTGLTINATGRSLTITSGEYSNASSLLNVHYATVSGTLYQGTGNMIANTYTIEPTGNWINTDTGDITVGSGGVTNNGKINFGRLDTCGAADGITITSSSGGSQRSWTGTGVFNIYDATISDQGGSATINAYSSTAGSGNGANWTISSSCPYSPARLGNNARLQGGIRLR